MILRHHCVLLAIFASLVIAVHSDVLETSVLSTSPLDSSTTLTGSKTSAFERRSSLDGNVAQSASNLDRRIAKTLDIVRSKIPTAVDSVEKDIAIANRDRVILALANFLGMVFGILKATAGSTNWADVGTGNKIQVFAQILYGYGYWGPFALEYENSRVDCGVYDLDRVVQEYGYVTDYSKTNLDPKIGVYFTSELNAAIKENLYCLTSKSSDNQNANEVDTYVNVYTQLLSEKIARS